MPESRLANVPRLQALFVSALVSLSLLGEAKAHDHRDHDHDHAKVVPPRETSTSLPVAKSSGSAHWRFRWNRELSALPEATRPYLPGAHGGFAVNWRGKREIYFGLKRCGVIRISPDLRKKEVLDMDPYVRSGNFHNTTLIYDKKGTAYLALPDNQKQRVYITTTEGKLVQVLSHPRVNAYFQGGGAFVPTDVEQVPGGDIYIVTGYSKGDYVVTADPFGGVWKKLVFGGKGRDHGKLGTGHGITWNVRTDKLDIADRPHSRIESFDTRGVYRGTLALPAGSLPCDIDFLDEVAVIGCLKGPGGKTPAPIYIVSPKGEIVSTVKPKEDLGLSLFTHLHNVTWHAVGDGESRKTFLLCQAWNPGGFAVLEHVASSH